MAGLKANASASNFERPKGNCICCLNSPWPNSGPWTPFLAEMVNLGVNLIAVIGTVTVRAVRRATSTIPIVFAVVVEPIATDWPRTWNVPMETSLG